MSTRAARKLRTKFKQLTEADIEQIIHIVNSDRTRVRVARVDKAKIENQDLWYYKAKKNYYFVWDNGGSDLKLLFDPMMQIKKEHCTMIRYEGIPESSYINSDIIGQFND